MKTILLYGIEPISHLTHQKTTLINTYLFTSYLIDTNKIASPNNYGSLFMKLNKSFTEFSDDYGNKYYKTTENVEKYDIRKDFISLSGITQSQIGNLNF